MILKEHHHYGLKRIFRTQKCVSHRGKLHAFFVQSAFIHLTNINGIFREYVVEEDVSVDEFDLKTNNRGRILHDFHQLQSVFKIARKAARVSKIFQRPSKEKKEQKPSFRVTILAPKEHWRALGRCLKGL